jgi:cation:H+ antiporter
MLAASELLTTGLSRLGVKLGLAEGLIGLLAALGADAPELSSSITALASGAREVGVGVLLGSNLFNLAALLGFSALVAGRIRLPAAELRIDAAAGIALLLLAAGLVTGLLPPVLALLPGLVLFGLYALALYRTAPDPVTDPGVRSWTPVWLLLPAIAGVVLGSVLTVGAALRLAPSLHLSGWLLGSVVLAGLTSLPNLYVALRFAQAGRGTALMSAATNSNSLNLLGGLMIPALIIGGAAARTGALDLTWLLAVTCLAVGLPLMRGSISRWGGLLIVAAYLAFVVSGLALGR